MLPLPYHHPPLLLLLTHAHRTVLRPTRRKSRWESRRWLRSFSLRWQEHLLVQRMQLWQQGRVTRCLVSYLCRWFGPSLRLVKPARLLQALSEYYCTQSGAGKSAAQKSSFSVSDADVRSNAVMPSLEHTGAVYGRALVHVSRGRRLCSVGFCCIW